MRRPSAYEERARELAVAAGLDPDSRVARPGEMPSETDATRGWPAWCGFRDAARAAQVSPTVVALRSKAAEVVDTELARLFGRLPGADDDTRAEIAQTVRRVVDKLLHTPTVRVKELVDSTSGVSYAEALQELFGLDRAAPAAVAATGLTLEEA